ncbi:MAG: hypothetical protein U0527_11435 [Candidatus Eisenbacteria bacterium]
MSMIPNDRVHAGSAGMQVNRMLDALGMPDALGDFIGAQIDVARGDVRGAMRNLIDLQSGMPTSALDAALGKGIGPQFAKGHVHRHRPHGPHLSHQRRGNFYQSEVGKKAHIGQRYGFNWGPFKFTGRITGQQYAGSFAKPVHLPNDKFLYQGRIYNDMNSIWRDMRDGKLDGLATARFTLPSFNFMPFLPGLGGPDTQPGSGAPSAGGAPGGAGGAEDPSTGDIMSGGGSLEDKLLLLMDKLAKFMDKQIEDQMKKIETEMQKQKQGGAAGSSGGGAGGLLGTLGGIAGGVIGGPLGGMAGSFLGGMIGGGAGGGSGSGGGDSSSTDKSNLQLMQAQLQQMIERRNQMFQTMTQMLKSLNDTSLSIIRNLKA